MRQSPPPRLCRSTGKIISVSLAAAGVRARWFADEMHRKRTVVETLYAYQCPACKSWHLTRKKGPQARLVYEAADPEIQRWGWRG